MRLFLLRSFHRELMKNIYRGALDKYLFKAVYFLVCISVGGSETELICFSLMDFADASKIFRHSITKLCIQGLTAALSLRLS